MGSVSIFLPYEIKFVIGIKQKGRKGGRPSSEEIPSDTQLSMFCSHMPVLNICFVLLTCNHFCGILITIFYNRCPHEIDSVTIFEK